jgi:hypothetical protein
VQLGWIEVSTESRGDGTETVVVRSAAPLMRQPRQFFRLAATLPAVAAPWVSAETTVLSTPVGVMTERLAEGLSGLSLPLIERDLLIGVVEANTTSALQFPAGGVSVGSLLSSGGKYYVEVLTGSFEGERLDVDTEATIAADGSTIVLALGPETFSTLPELAADTLVGARCALRPHMTLARLQAMITPGLRGSDHSAFADGVLILEEHGFERYTLRADGVTWHRHGSELDQGGKVIPPDVSFLVQTSSHRRRWLHTGEVRTNLFRKNLVHGLQAFATGFPEDLSPAQIGAFVDPEEPAQIRWTGSNVFAFADQIQRIADHRRPFDLYYLRADGTTWRTLRDPRNLANEPILGVTDMLLLRRVKPNPTFAIVPPFGL